MNVEVDGLNIAFERTGAGPAVALAHGFVGDARSTWASQIETLADEFTVIAWDAPGAGGSSDPPEASASTPTPTAWPGSSGHCGSSEHTSSGSPSVRLWRSRRSTGTADSRCRSP